MPADPSRREGASTPEAVVQRQLEAYNARDLARFLAEYADDIAIVRLPAVEPALRGKPALSEFYATQRFNRAGLHAEIVDRIAFGNKVIDHERITGVRDQPFDVAAVYEVVDGLIARAWFVAAE